MNNDTTTVETHLARLRGVHWTGPDRNARVELALQEYRNMQHTHTRHRLGLGLLLAAIFAGGALAGGVAHRMLTGKVYLIESDGTRYELGIPEGGVIDESGLYIDPDGNAFQTPEGVQIIIEEE